MIGSSEYRQVMGAGHLTPGSVRIISGGKTTTLFTLGEPNEHLGFGASVVSIGDVNFDGTQDFAVGVPDVSVESTRNASTGNASARIYSGRDSKLLYSVGPCGGVEVLMCGLGDVDHDGVRDFAVLFEHAAGSLVRIVSGRDGKTVREWGRDPQAPWESIANVGDVDGDGAADIALGSRAFRVREHAVGIVRVYSAMNGKIIHSWVNEGDMTEIGRIICGLGDIDGDGYPDVAIGACRKISQDKERAVVLIRSGKDGSILRELSIGEAATGPVTSIAAVGDVDLDGVSDLAVCVAWCTDAPATEGCCVVFSGRTWLPICHMPGRLISALRKTDGGGRGELLLSSPFSNHGGTNRGAVRVYNLNPKMVTPR
jgi:hypothetical protein